MSALSTISGIDSLVLEGEARTSEISKVLQGASISRTIEGASTLTLEIYDDQRRLLHSGAFDNRVTAYVDSYTFELVKVRKLGHALTVVLEDLPVAALRRHKTPLKVAPNTTTHIDFAERLVREEPWIKFWVPEELRSAERTKVEIARGKPSAAGEEEDSWTALGRIAEERGWRRYVADNTTLTYITEEYLLKQPAEFQIRENTSGVENIDFDFDMGKPLAAVSMIVRAARWSLPIGSVVEILDVGPASGKWIVSNLTRSLFSLNIEVKLTKARPVIPEPEPSVSASSSAGSGSGGSTRSSWPSNPTNLVKLVGQKGNHRLVREAADSFLRVQEKFGQIIPISDSYRPASSQAAGYARNPNRFAKPGTSAHGEGRAVDVDLTAIGAYPKGEPSHWLEDERYRAMAEAFMDEGWCNYQIKNGTAKGRLREPWHWAYQVCK